MNLPANVTRAFGRAALQAKKNSPHISFGVGIAAVVGGGVLACKATLQLEDKLEKIHEDLDTVNNAQEAGIRSDQEITRVKSAIYIKGGLSLVRLYGPSVLLAGVGIGLLTNSHIQMHKRNQALTAALAAVQKAYDDYRERVREEIGEDREKSIFNDIREIAERDAALDRGPFSAYARCFDEYNKNYVKSAELNMCFLKLSQAHANDYLQLRGHLFLNEVYDMLGMERSQIGSVVGWLWNSERGDNFIDFGFFNDSRFVDGLERSVWLDFNVDGVIFDKI